MKRLKSVPRVSFSNRFTWLNMLVSTLGYVVWQIWSSFTIEEWTFYSNPLWHTMLVISITFTALFLHFEILCCSAGL